MATYPALDIRFDPGPGAGALQDQLYAELDAFEPIAIHEHDAGDGWRVFFKGPIQRADAHHALTTLFGGHVLDVTAIDVDDEDWARRSQAGLQATQVGGITVAPPWDVPVAAGITIVIEPSMGFGTGHHATTRLCLEWMQQVDLRGARVIDVGTGSGVLAIAARMLGAATVVAVDHDPDALRNARENAGRNGVDIAIVEADLDSWRAAPADVLVANLTGAVLRRFADVLRALAGPSGTVIVSGFGPDEAAAVVAALGPAAHEVRVEGEWAAARLTMPR